MKKKSIILSMSSIMILGGITLSYAEFNSPSTDLNIIYNNSLQKDNSNTIEYVKTTFENGAYLENFRDTKNKLDRVDYYDENGTFTSRELSFDNGKKIISIGLDEGKYTAVEWNVDDEIAKFNNDILENSIIQTSLNELGDVSSFKESRARNVHSENTKVYTTNNSEIYVDTEDMSISKVKSFNNGELNSTIEYDTLHKDNLFEINSPLNTRTRHNVDLSNIEIIGNEGIEGSSIDKNSEFVG